MRPNMLLRLVKRSIVVLMLSHILSERGLPGLLSAAGITGSWFSAKLRVIALIVVLSWLVYDARQLEIATIEVAETEAEVKRHHVVCKMVMDLVCPYDAEACAAVRRFAPIKKGSRCLFAKAARLWGSKDYDKTLTIEANVAASVPTLLQMLHRGEAEGLDGFVFEIRVTDLGADMEAFVACVRRVLCAISDCDPTGERSARKSYVGDRSWHFVFARFPIFVTTFAPCYGTNSSRFTYDADPHSVFILLQPEYSFLRHDLPADTPHTAWNQPRTIRDRIRVSFRNAGQPYEIPATVHYPASEHIVKPLEVGQPAIRWWQTPGDEQNI